MVNLDLKTLTITGASKLLRNREISPVDLISATLSRIHSANPKLNAFTTVTEDYAMTRAYEAEKCIQSSQYLGPLHGIPYTLKDVIDTRGIKTTYGYRSHQDHIPTESATVHSKLEAAGAILVGKTYSHLRRFISVPCFNPWDLSRSPGVSSSGSAAALAASLGLASIGSDTGGSVRLPAAWTGVVGLRGTTGLISRHNALGPSWSIDQVGPMARTVEDIAILLQAIAGYDPLDPITLRDRVPDYHMNLRSSIKGIKIGIFEELLTDDSEPEVEASVRSAIQVLRTLGAELTEVRIPKIDDTHKGLGALAGPESYAYYQDVFSSDELSRIDDDMKQYLAQASTQTMSDYLWGQRVMARLKQDLADIFNDVDLILSPTSLTAPLPVSLSDVESKITVKGRDVNAWKYFTRSTHIASLAGLPAISVPCGLIDGYLPVGLQLMGRRLEESLILQVAFAYEQAAGWHQYHPEIS
jgi:aspartyl-tRNA(Asn)/glutamyl-tRNA(Gln) amidotransferase subunit A